MIFIMTLLMILRGKTKFPGPPRLPLIGSIPWLKMKRGAADWVLSPVITKHKVAFVQIGHSFRIHVINDFKMAKDLFSLDIFAYREPSEFAKHHRWLSPDKPVGIIFNNNERWSTQRRFGLRTLRDFGFGKQSLEATINIEIDEMIERFASEKGDVKIGGDFNVPIINILWQVVAGYRILPEDTEGVRMVELVNRIFKKGPSTLQMLPFFMVRLLPNLTGYTERAGILDAQREYMLKIIDQHIDTFDPEHIRDFIDVYLLQMRVDKEKKFTRGDLCSMMLDFFHAGTETTSTTLSWTLLHLTSNQKVQGKCREEIRRVIGDRRPEASHMQELPYTMATLTEIQRLSCVAPVSLPHNTTQGSN